MTGSQVVDAKERASRATRFFRWMVPYLLLVVSTALAVVSPPHEPGRIALILGLATAAGIWLWRMFPGSAVWAQRRGVIILYFSGQLAFITALVAVSPWFMVFAAVGYAHALVLLPPRWLVVGVAATATLTAVAQDGLLRLGGTIEAPHVFAMAIALPLLFVSWFVGGQSEKRYKMIEELAEANAKLEGALRENLGLHAQLLAQAREAGILDERQRLAREIHDTLAQGLIGIITQLQASERSKDRPEVRQQHIDNAARLAADSLAEARRSVQAVRPELLESACLPEALGEVVEQWTAMNAARGVFASTGEARRLHLDVEVALLRCVQEALANVTKHAHATDVRVSLSYLPDVVVLDVHDNGIGFDPRCVNRAGNGSGLSDVEGGFGLDAMRQRAVRLGGALTIDSAVDRGTAISLRMPAWPSDGALPEVRRG